MDLAVACLHSYVGCQPVSQQLCRVSIQIDSAETSRFEPHLQDFASHLLYHTSKAYYVEGHHCPRHRYNKQAKKIYSHIQAQNSSSEPWSFRVPCITRPAFPQTPTKKRQLSRGQAFYSLDKTGTATMNLTKILGTEPVVDAEEGV
jgi:hypothetical protein